MTYEVDEANAKVRHHVSFATQCTCRCTWFMWTMNVSLRVHCVTAFELVVVDDDVDNNSL